MAFRLSVIDPALDEILGIANSLRRGGRRLRHRSEVLRAADEVSGAQADAAAQKGLRLVRRLHRENCEDKREETQLQQRNELGYRNQKGDVAVELYLEIGADLREHRLHQS